MEEEYFHTTKNVGKLIPSLPYHPSYLIVAFDSRVYGGCGEISVSPEISGASRVLSCESIFHRLIPSPRSLLIVAIWRLWFRTGENIGVLGNEL